jgi:hypothetical protein
MKKLLVFVLFVFIYANLCAQNNEYKGVPIEVIGIPYTFDDIKGERSFDRLIEQAYDCSKWTSFSFLNFKVTGLTLDFKDDGSLVISTLYSYDKTPASGNSFYPAKPDGIHDWNISQKFHSHTQQCSLDRYDDYAKAQHDLNIIRQDKNLEQVYQVVLSVATDMDYDYNKIGKPVTFINPKPLTGVCDDYAKLLIDRLVSSNIKGITEIKKITGHNHAWVTCKYNGKLLFLDATWFDKNSILANGLVDHIPYKDPDCITFNEDIFTNHGAHHIPD